MQTLDVLTLDGQQLDYFTGLALGYEMFDGHPYKPSLGDNDMYKPSLGGNDLTDVLLKIRVIMKGARCGEWLARADGCNAYATAQTLPVAVCRAVVLGRWGSTVELVDLCEDLFA